MDLYFLRHGEAAPDGERPLTSEGAREVGRVARWLREHNVRPDLILSSPLARALQTAQLVADALGVQMQVEDRLACGARLEQVMELLKPLGRRTRVMLVGHEPDFSDMIGELIGGAAVEMKKAGLARVDCEVLGPGGGVLRWLLTPKLMD